MQAKNQRAPRTKHVSDYFSKLEGIRQVAGATTIDQKPPYPTPDFIVSDGLKINDPLEIWVDWDPDIDLSMENRVGTAHWEGGEPDYCRRTTSKTY